MPVVPNHAVALAQEFGGCFVNIPEPRDRREKRARKTRPQMRTFASYVYCPDAEEEDRRVTANDPLRPPTDDEFEDTISSVALSEC